MAKIVLISGSNRKGNTEYILSELSKHFTDSNLILLKNQNIQYCKGCLACHHYEKCILKDDMNLIIEQLKEAELIIFGVPNYFDNVTGLFKNFIDRLHPLYKSEALKNKKVIFIFVGGGSIKGTKETLHQSIKGLPKYLLIDVKKEFTFQALNIDDMKKQKEKIRVLVDEIKKYI